MRRILFICLSLLAVAIVLAAGALADSTRTYRVEFDNAFGLVKGSDVRVAGVNAGEITDLDVTPAKKAVVTIKLNLKGFDSFRADATCRSLPQSLIAEYFVDCQPGKSGRELPDGGTVPVKNTQINVQPDLVNNILREPYAQRLQLIINEFGTGLAGNGTELNSAIRRGVPALQQTRKVLDILARQNKTIGQLNRDSDVVVKALADNRTDVARFIQTAGESAAAAGERREDLKRQFALLPGFLRELEPTMRELGNVADQQIPLLTDLRRAGGGLNRLADNLIPFAKATQTGIDSLAKASRTGRRALTKGADEISELRRASLKLEPIADQTSKLLSDLDDPGRAVERNTNAEKESGRAAPSGYSGFEALLQFVRNLNLANNQYDSVGYFLRIQLNEIEGACGSLSADYARAEEGSKEPNRCVSWLGPNQPQLTEPLSVPAYDPAVCPQGSADLTVCNPAGSSGDTPPIHAANAKRTAASATPAASGGSAQASAGEDAKTAPLSTALPKPLQDILDLPQDLLRGKADAKGNRSGGLLDALGAQKPSTSGADPARRDPATTNDLLDFLFGN